MFVAWMVIVFAEADPEFQIWGEVEPGLTARVQGSLRALEALGI